MDTKELIGRKLSGFGILKEENGTICLLVPVLHNTFHISGLSNCQSVYSSNILFTGTFLSNDTIQLLEIDDIPTEENCQACQNFMSVIIANGYCICAFRTELCDISAEGDHFHLTCNINREKVSVNFLPGGITPESDPEDWFYSHEVILTLTTLENTEINKENKEILLTDKVRCDFYH